MKKLFLFSVITVAAIAVNAASCNWSVTLNGGAAGKILGQGTSTSAWTAEGSNWAAYFVLASDVSTLVDGIKAGNVTASMYLDKATDGFTTTMGIMPTARAASGDAITTAAQAFDVVLVYDKDEETYYQVSSSQSTEARTLATDPASVTFKSNLDFAQGNWQAVPEPFSGSLALLGVGLVALRRRMKKQKKA